MNHTSSLYEGMMVGEGTPMHHLPAVVEENRVREHRQVVGNNGNVNGGRD